VSQHQSYPGEWAAPPPPAPSTPPGPFAADLLGALRTAARGVLPVLGGLVVLAVAVGISASAAGADGSPADWLLAAVVLLGLGLGARVVASGQVDSGMASAGFDAGVRVLPLLVTILVVVLLARAARREERVARSSGPGQLLLRAGLTGLVVGLVVLVLALLTRTSSVLGADLGDATDAPGGVSAGLGAVGAFVLPTLLVAVTVAAARWSVVRTGAPRPAWWAEVLVVARVQRTFAVGVLVVAAIGVLGYVLQQALTEGLGGGLGDDDGGAVVAVGLALVLSVNVVLVAGMALLGVPLTASASGAGSFLGSGFGGVRDDQLALTDEPVLLLVLLVPVLVVLVTGVRRTVRGAQLPLTGRSVGVAAGTGAAAGLVLALLLRVWLSGGGAGTSFGAVASAQASAGPSLLWAPLLGAVWSALAVAAVRVGPTLVLSSPARLVRLVGGRRQHPQWLAAVAGTGPAPAGHRSAAVRGTVVGIGALALLGVVGVGALLVVRSTVLTPESALDDHLAALASGDVAVLGPDGAPGPGDVLLSPDVLGSGAYQPPTDTEVVSVEEYGSYASAEIRYSVDGEQITDRVSMSREDGLLGGWVVEQTAPDVYVEDGDGLGVQVGGVDVPSGPQRALPGTYTFSAAEDDVLTADDVTVGVGGYAFADVTLEPRVREEITEKVAQAVDAVVADCAARTTVPMEGCPFLGRYSYVPDDVTGLAVQVTQLPDWELELDYDGQLVIRSDYDGEGTVTGTRPPYSFDPTGAPRPWDSTFSFSLDADVEVDGDRVQLEFSGY
jgi:hypothetical protein